MEDGVCRIKVVGGSGGVEACVWDSVCVVSWDSVAGAGRRVGGT